MEGPFKLRKDDRLPQLVDTLLMIQEIDESNDVSSDASGNLKQRFHHFVQHEYPGNSNADHSKLIKDIETISNKLAVATVKLKGVLERIKSR